MQIHLGNEIYINSAGYTYLTDSHEIIQGVPEVRSSAL